VQASSSQRNALATKVWLLRFAFTAVLVVLAAASSGMAALAFAVSSGANLLFLRLFMRGSLSLPRVLEQVHEIEPVIYHWLGVGLVKRIVATRLWPVLIGFDPPPQSKSRQDLLNRTEMAARGAEVCHAATFALTSLVGLVFLSVDNVTAAVWIAGCSVVLDGYPVMMQRCHRWRVQCIRAQISKGKVPSSYAGVRAAQLNC
jgi:hypothetical protein